MIFMLFLCMMLLLNIIIILPQLRQLSGNILPQNPQDFFSTLKEKFVCPYFGKPNIQDLPPFYKDTGNSNLIIQYRIQPNGTDEELLNRANVPVEFRTGHPLLSTRTYPRSPRKMHCHECFLYIYENVLRPDSCDAPGDVWLLILITTVPAERELRNAIRQTWLSVTKNNTSSVRYLFLLGTGWPAKEQAIVEEESEEFNDFLQDDYIDSYFNLSIKVLSGFNFGITHCKRAQFIMRTADDNYVNIPNILFLLHRKKRLLQDKIFGECARYYRILRSKTSKWAVTLNEWPLSRYPPYCIGTAFLMSRSIMEKVYHASKNVPYFVIEDVFFGEVAQQIGIDLLRVPNMMLPVPNFIMFSQNPCIMNNQWRAVHNATAAQQYLIWKHCPQRRDLPKF